MRRSLLVVAFAIACSDAPPLRYDAPATVPLPQLLAAPAPGPAGLPGAAPPAELTIQFVHRLPEIDSVWGSENAAVEGWPAPGQQITWRASVKNWFPGTQVVSWRWLLDGTEVASGATSIAGGAVGTVDHPWAWTFERHLDPRAFQIGRDPEGAPATRPNVADRTVDLQWGFPKTALSAFANFTDRAIFNPFYWYSGAVQHEMGHCRGMVDVYAFAVFDGFPGFEVDIREGGTRIPGTALLPGREEINNGFTGRRLSTAQTGPMSLDWTYLDRLSAIVWERMKGKRAKFGNYNESEDIGWFLNDLLPGETRVRILDDAGRPAPGVSLQVFQATPPPLDHWKLPHPRVYDGVPDLRATTGADGEASLGHNPWAASGPVIHTEDFSNATVIVRAGKGGSVKYFFLQVNEAIERAVPDRSAATAVRKLSF